MKNVFNISKYLFLSGLVISTIISCDDELNAIPNDRVSEDIAFTTEAEFRQGVDASYDLIKVGGYYALDNSQNVVPDLLTDNLIVNQVGRKSNSSAYIFDFSADNTSVNALYGSAYAAISRANFVLSKTQKVPSSAFMTNISAEARAIRAACHFDIVRAYSKIPTQSSDASGSLGIYYQDQFNLFATPARNLTVVQVYDRIIDDLNFASANITNVSSDKGRFSKAAVLGLLSRVYLYKGDYPNAITSGQACLALESSVGTNANFKKIWSDDSIDGVLFKVLNASTEAVKTGTCYNQTIGGEIKSEYVVDFDFYQKFQNTDIRKSSYIQTSTFQSKSYNNVIKHRQATGKPVEAVDIKYLRTAEVVLNVAEAMFKTGNTSGALSLLNTLRAQRYTPFIPGTETGTQLWDAIMLERRLELAFESDRFFTLKRLGLPVQRSVYGDLSNGTGTPTTVSTLSPSSHKWQWPIPIEALTLNANLVQNPGY